MKAAALHNGITFIVTRRCPLQCDHCVMESGPWYDEYLTGEQMKRWIGEARASGITRISYSGGDPVLYLREVAAAVAFAHGLGMTNSLFTSAFWATSVEKADATLERLRGVDVLGLSTSTFHQKFVPLERVANAVVAARARGIRGVAVQIADSARESAAIEARLRELLPEEVRQIPVERQSLFRAGRSTTSVTIPEEDYKPLDEVDTRCPAPALTIEPDGLLRGCCSSLLALRAKNPLILGDVAAEGLPSVLLRAARQKHYHVLRAEGLDPVLRVLREDGFADSLPDRAVNACDLCFQIYRQPALTAHLASRFAGDVGGAPGGAP